MHFYAAIHTMLCGLFSQSIAPQRTCAKDDQNCLSINVFEAESKLRVAECLRNINKVNLWYLFQFYIC